MQAQQQQQQQQQQTLPADIKHVLFSAEEVRGKVAELAQQIAQDYKGKPLAVIGVLNGAFIFTSGLWSPWYSCTGS